MSLNKDKKARNWLRQIGIDGIAKFDLKNKDIVLYDGGLIAIKKKTRKQRGKLSTDRVKEDVCTIWFESIDETIEYLKKMKTFLVGLGYKTDGTYMER